MKTTYSRSTTDAFGAYGIAVAAVASVPGKRLSPKRPR